MEVILLQKVANLGKIGDKVKVKPGYGRNFLLPQGKAALATAANLKKFEERRSELEKLAADELTSATLRAGQLEGFRLKLDREGGRRGQDLRLDRHGGHRRGAVGRRHPHRAQRSAPALGPDPRGRRASREAAPAQRRDRRPAGGRGRRGIVLAAAVRPMDQDAGDARGRRRLRPASDTDALRVPPHSVEAEQAVLGGLLLDNSTWDSIADRLTAEDFYRRDHQQIFAAIAELSARSEPADAVTLAEYLAAKGQADETGGLAYLAGLARDTPTAANIRAYADIVRERSLLRHLIRVSGEIAASAYDSEGRPRQGPGGRCRAPRVRDRRGRPPHRIRLRAAARHPAAPPSTASTCCTRTRGSSRASRPATPTSTA